MTRPAVDPAEIACLETLERALGTGETPALTGCPATALDGALRELTRRYGAGAATLIRGIADHGESKLHRKTARLAIYRLTQAGIPVPAASAPAPPVVARPVERPVRAWLSGIDGSGSRAAWILFEGGVGGGLVLCSVILNDESGILEAAGGPITRKRLDRELAQLREHQKLPWVETDPVRACRLVAETLELHARRGTDPPAAFARWRRLFSAARHDAPAAAIDRPPQGVDAALADRVADLLELPELAGWFVDPAAVQEDALALLQARESRLVVSDQVKAERESAIVDGVIERLFTHDVRARWARRLEEMALIFRDTGRDEPMRIAWATAAALSDVSRDARRLAFARALVLRGLEMAGEVALGRATLSDVSRAPARRAGG